MDIPEHWFYQKTATAKALGNRIDKVLDLGNVRAPMLWEDSGISHVRNRGVQLLAGYELVAYSRTIWGLCLYGEYQRASEATSLLIKPAQQGWDLARDNFAFSIFVPYYLASRYDDTEAVQKIMPVVEVLLSDEKEALFGKDQLALKEDLFAPFANLGRYTGPSRDRDILTHAISDLSSLVSMCIYRDGGQNSDQINRDFDQTWKHIHSLPGARPQQWKRIGTVTLSV